MGPEGPSRQYRLPPPVASYNREFKGMLNEMTAVLDFILWHTTLVAFDTFLYLSVILHEFGSSFWTKRETWRKFKKIASSSGAVGDNHHSYLEGACSTFDDTFLVKCR